MEVQNAAKSLGNKINHLKEKCRAAELQIRGERGIEDNSEMIFLIS